MLLAQKRADYTRRRHAAASTRAASARTARAFPASLRERVAPAPHEKRPALGEAFFRNLGRDQIRWTIWTAVGMPNRTMDLPYLERSFVQSFVINNRSLSDFYVGRQRNVA